MDKKGLDIEIEVDGGVDHETAKLCRDAGANVFVAGSYIYGNKNRQTPIDKLRAIVGE